MTSFQFKMAASEGTIVLMSVCRYLCIDCFIKVLSWRKWTVHNAGWKQVGLD